ncbi:apoptosis facilitator Bcl-2-like protein 14 [Rhinophrynus dorsalis]
MVTVQESTMEEIPLQEDENCMEYRVLMVYAQRTLSASKYNLLKRNENGVHVGTTEESPEPRHKGNGKEANGHQPTTAKGETPRKEKKKSRKSWRKRIIPKCLRPQDDMGTKQKKVTGDPETKRAYKIAKRLQDIIEKYPPSNQSSFRSLQRTTSLEHDGEDDADEQLIQDIVQILRQSGDRLDKEMKEDKTLLQRFRTALSYRFFQRLINDYLSAIISSSEPEAAEESCKMALCIDVTSRLTTLDNQPMNKVMGFGVKYLKENFTPWVQSQGGWENAVGIHDEEEIE